MRKRAHLMALEGSFGVGAPGLSGAAQRRPDQRTDHTLALWHAAQADHDRFWELCNFLTGGSGRGEGSARQRRSAAQELVALESQHEVAEELVIWPAVREMLPDGPGMVAVASAQERQAKRALNELRHLGPGSQDFAECLHTLAGMARAHMSYEQNQVWPALAGCLSAEQAAAMLDRWQKQRSMAPVRPHPHVPMRPLLLGRIGPLAAAGDRTLASLRRHAAKLI